MKRYAEMARWNIAGHITTDGRLYRTADEAIRSTTPIIETFDAAGFTDFSVSIVTVEVDARGYRVYDEVEA